MVKSLHSTFAAAVAVLLATVPAHAYELQYAPVLPPAAFDHEPTEPYQLFTMTPDEIVRLCHPAPFTVSVGCTLIDYRIVLIRDDLSATDFDFVKRHEFGHLNGWVH